jgi:hypothetical protein
MPDAVEALALPFGQAIEHFRGKVNLPTRTWLDIRKGQHARAFVVAGATKAELLADFNAAVRKGIEKGTTLAEFRKDFDSIVAKHGWDYKGGRDWRSKVIYQTNLATAYSAGRYAQMTTPAVLRARPFWRYIASSSREKRVEHMAWYNLVLPADDPWWDTHWPPSAWGCKCGVTNHSAREVEQLKAEGVDIKTEAPKDGTYEWKNPRTGEVETIPVGVGPGWNYNVGEAAWGRRLSEQAMAEWQAQGAKAWETLTPGDWRTYARPEMIPVDAPRATLGERLTDAAQVAAAIAEQFGGPERVFSFERPGFRYDILANAETLAEHIPADRSPFLPFLAELLEDPFEVWLAFERHRGTGKIELRTRVIKAVQLEKERGLLLVAQARKGMLEAWTMLLTRNLDYLNDQRRGKLLWTR